MGGFQCMSRLLFATGQFTHAVQAHPVATLFYLFYTVCIYSLSHKVFHPGLV